MGNYQKNDSLIVTATKAFVIGVACGYGASCYDIEARNARWSAGAISAFWLFESSSDRRPMTHVVLGTVTAIVGSVIGQVASNQA